MTEESLQTRLADLESRIAAMPADLRKKLQPIADETRLRHAQIRQSVDSARNALDDWRLLMKYLVFDAEARRREIQE